VPGVSRRGVRPAQQSHSQPSRRGGVVSRPSGPASTQINRAVSR
jgi:hypothetical protein